MPIIDGKETGWITKWAMQAESVEEEAIKALAVTEAKIANAAVTTAKLASIKTVVTGVYAYSEYDRAVYA